MGGRFWHVGCYRKTNRLEGDRVQRVRLPRWTPPGRHAIHEEINVHFSSTAATQRPSAGAAPARAWEVVIDLTNGNVLREWAVGIDPRAAVEAALVLNGLVVTDVAAVAACHHRNGRSA